VSRLTALSIPFAAGHSDEVDEKLLPNGVFADVRNGRLPQVGSLRLRRGWRPLAMLDQATGVSITGIDLHSHNESLLVVDSGFRVAALTEANSSQPWSLYTDARLPPVTQVRRMATAADLTSDVTRASAAVTADGVYGCVVQQTATQTVVRVFEMSTDDTVLASALSNGSRLRKVVSLGSTFGLVEYTGTELRLLTLDPTATAPAFGSAVTLVTATVDWFDAATAYDSTPTALHLAYVVAGEALYAKFSSAGVQSGSAKQVVAADAVAVAVCCRADVTAHVAYQLDADEEVRVLSFSATSPYTTAAGPTAVLAGQDVRRGGFAIADNNGLQIEVAVEHENAGGFDDAVMTTVEITGVTTHSLVEAYEHQSTALWGGFLARSGHLACGAVRTNFSSANNGPVRTNLLQDHRSPMAYLEFALGYFTLTRAQTPPFWPGQAPTGDCLVPTPLRAETATPGATQRVALDTFQLKFATTERRQSAQLAGGLYITGGILSQWLTGQLVENGLLYPVIDDVTGANGAGSIANGTYEYRAVVVWTDSRRRLHRSPVSPAITHTYAGTDDTGTITVHVPKTRRRSGTLSNTPVVELYRTEAGPGELFYRVATAAASAGVDAVTLTDISADASIIDEPQLYTQGEIGATSGILEQAPARPAAYVTATKRRLAVGSADTAYQFSQVSFPETPIWFAEPGVSGDAAQAYFDDVEGGRITGVAALDELTFIGTRDRIYLASGAGPNLAGQGEFEPPHRLPSDFGFYDWRSILETAEGLWFQGSAEVMCRLPRGAAAPEAEDARVSAGIVGCGYEAIDETAVWAASDATTLVRQTGEAYWLGDALPFTPIAMVGHRGVLYALASNGVVWRYDTSAYGDGTSGATAVALRVTTGAIQPFEMAGQGRLAVVELLGEFQTAAALLAEISYDDGVSWTSLGTHTVTGLSAGAAWQRQWYPARQRGGRFRLRFTMTPSSTTAEGCRLTGATVYVVRKSGQSRLDSAKRR
jgi:hypothetical protein